MKGYLKLLAPLVLIGAAMLPAMAQTGMNVNARLHRQAVRIHQGAKARDLNKYQAHRLRAGVARIRGQEAHDLRANGGHLTKLQRHHLEGQLNHTSHVIYKDKHNVH